MAKSNRGGRRASMSITPQATQQPTMTMASGGGGARAFTTMSDKDAQQLRDDMEDMYDADVTDAIKLYISNSNPNGDGFSHAQNLNFKLDNNLPLNANEKFIDDNIQKGMHTIGKDTQLVRYCHDDIVKRCGIQDYTKYSDSQLKSMLIGTELETTSYSSFSYNANKNPFKPGAPQGNGREVVINFNASANTKMVFGAKKQAEIVINKGEKIRITNVHYDGTYAYPRNKGTMPRIVIDVESVGG